MLSCGAYHGVSGRPVLPSSFAVGLPRVLVFTVSRTRSMMFFRVCPESDADVCAVNHVFVELSLKFNALVKAIPCEWFGNFLFSREANQADMYISSSTTAPMAPMFHSSTRKIPRCFTVFLVRPCKCLGSEFNVFESDMQISCAKFHFASFKDCFLNSSQRIDRCVSNP